MSKQILQVNFKNVTINYELFDHSFTRRWAMALQYSLESKHFNEQSLGSFFGSGLVSEKLLRENIQRCINIVNKYRSNSILNHTYPDMKHVDLMKIHVDFERLEPQVHYRTPIAPKEVAIALTDMNIYIHQYEGLYGPFLDHIDVTPKIVNRYVFEKSDYLLFKTDIEKGNIYLSYGVTGVPPLYAYQLNHDVRSVPQSNYTTGFQLAFHTRQHQLNHQHMKKWFQEKWQMDCEDPKIALGYIPLGKMQNIENIDNVIATILQDPQITSFQLLPHPSLADFEKNVKRLEELDSTAQILSGTIPVSSTIPAQWPYGKELFKHFEVRPYLFIPFEFNYKECLKEANKLLGNFVVHREYDQETADSQNGKWKSLGIYAVNGDSSKTQNHTDYGINEPIYKLSEISHLCPHTIQFLESITDLEQCQRIRFMLLEPGAKIKFHSDAPDKDVTIAINVALNMPTECFFRTDLNADGSSNLFTHDLPIKDGSIFILNNAPYHMLENNSNENRIHIIIHGPIRISSERLLTLARNQNQLPDEKLVTNALAFKRCFTNRNQDADSNVLLEWLQLGIDSNFFPTTVALALFEDENISKDIAHEALHCISAASIFPIKPPTIKIREATDWLKKEYKSGSRYAVLIGAGTYARALQDFYLETAKAIQVLENSNAIIMGHIMNKYNHEQKQLPFLHEQFAIVNLKLWHENGEVPLDIPYNNKQLSFPAYVSSKENFHDDYTPHWLKKDNMNASTHLGQSGWCTELIGKSLDSGLPVINIPAGLRNSKKFSYPRSGRDYQYLDIKKDINNFFEMCANKVFVFNNETLKTTFIPDLLPDCFVSVASGFKPFIILKQYFSQKSPKKIIFVDYSLRTIEHFKKIVFSKNKEQLIDILCHEYNFQSPLLKSDKITIQKNLEEIISKELSGQTEQLFRYLDMAKSAEFLHLDLIGNYHSLLEKIDPTDRCVMWFSNAWDSNASLFNYSTQELESRFLEFGQQLACRLQADLYKKRNRFELLCSDSANTPIAFVADSCFQKFNTTEYVKVDLNKHFAKSDFYFKHNIKLYFFYESRKLTLSLKLSGSHVRTFYFNEDIFNKVITDYSTKNGFDNKNFFVIQKNGYIRFTHKTSDVFEDNFRLDQKQWLNILNDYRNKIKKNQHGEYFTCTV